MKARGNHLESCENRESLAKPDPLKAVCVMAALSMHVQWVWKVSGVGRARVCKF